MDAELLGAYSKKKTKKGKKKKHMTHFLTEINEDKWLLQFPYYTVSLLYCRPTYIMYTAYDIHELHLGYINKLGIHKKVV